MNKSDDQYENIPELADESKDQTDSDWDYMDSGSNSDWEDVNTDTFISYSHNAVVMKGKK